MYEYDSLFDPPAESSLPPGLLEMGPGAGLGNLLSGVDSPSLSRYERVQLISAYRRQVSHYQALFYGEIARLYAQELGEDPEALTEDSAWAVRTELGAALHLSPPGEPSSRLASPSPWSGRLGSTRRSLGGGSISIGPR
ncbi:MAG TPA: hypothetical protein VJ930_06920 [Acidimicrobiia bacterium]|nr:hypothetical protein [Acidimicrobiia bacterium]